MKRSRHRWLGLSIFCVTLSVLSQDIPTASAARATSLIFAKTTTSTTTTTPAPEEPTAPGGEEQLDTEGERNVTNSKLTGIPQVDYVYDPNLPRELNGFNLSEYPFYDTVPKPELMNFKCDGLHDGFYASVEHKCQVYHHCIYGIRHDFLCANYTAFDQKTFICQFVSVVDCKNSANYFHRNDALYKATTTTTIAPPPTTSTTTTTPRPRPRTRRPHRYDYYDDDYYYPARDDYEYEDRGGRRRPRPRPQGRPGGRKRRPMDDYEDDRFERRPRPRDEQPEDDYDDRRPYDRPSRPGKRPLQERRPYDDEEDRRPGYRQGIRRPRPRDEDEDRYREDDRPRNKDRPIEKRPRDEIRTADDFDTDEIRNEKPRDETRSREERPKAGYKSRDEVKARDEIRPRDDIRPRDEIRSRDEIRPRDEVRPRDEIRPRDEVRSRDEIRPRDKIRPRDERPRDEIRPRDERPREELMRPRDEAKLYDEKPRDERRPQREDTQGSNSARTSVNEGRRYKGDREKPKEERPFKAEPKPERTYDDDRYREERRQPPTAPEGQTLVKPNGRGIFSMPRAAPKIKRPVPANERDKYEYVPITTTKAPHRAEDDEYYDDYEEEDTRKPSSSGKTSTVQERPKYEPVVKEKFKPSRPHQSSPTPKPKNTRPSPIDYDDDEYYYEPPLKSQKYTYSQKVRETPKVKATDDYYDEYDDKRERDREIHKSKDEDISSKIKDLKPNVKVLKRPFLPSRGGSPYLPRGLQPVAGKDLTAPPNTTPKPTTTSTTTTTTTTTTTPKPTTTSTTTTTTTTTEKPTTTTEKVTTTTERLTTTSVTTEKPTTTDLFKDDYEEEYYDEDDIDYDKKETTTELEQTTQKPTTTTTTVKSTTEVSSKDQAKFLAAKVLRVYNDNYQAIKDKLETTLSPGDYLKPYLAAEQAAAEEEKQAEIREQEAEIREKELKNKKKHYEYRQTEAPFKPSPQIPEVKPDISNPYTATGKPLRIPENIPIKQNLADSIENEYDVRLNEAITPNLPNVNVRNNIPSGFTVPSDRDYTFSRFRNSFQQEPQYAASELTNYEVRRRPQISGVSIRTPSSYYLQPQRYTDLQRPQRHLVYDIRPQGVAYNAQKTVQYY